LISSPPPPDAGFHFLSYAFRYFSDAPFSSIISLFLLYLIAFADTPLLLFLAALIIFI